MRTGYRLLYPIVLWALALGFALSHPAHAGETMSVAEYLAQTQRAHVGLQSHRLAAEGASQRADEGELLLAWSLVAGGQYTADASPTLSAAFQGNQTNRSAYSLGVTKLTSFGLRTSVTYNVNHTSVLGVDANLVPLPRFFDTGPVLELTLPLWKNFLGIETRANQDLLQAQALSKSLSASFQAKVTLSQAENAYWNLSLARAVVELQRESLGRAKEVEKWARRQVSRGLADRSDLLQAEALVEVRELELQQARDELRTAALTFNSLRGLEHGEVEEALVPVADVAPAELALPEREELRDDVRAAQQASIAAVASAELGKQKALPTFEVFGSAALKGRDSALSAAVDESWTTSHPVYTAGVRLVAPLDFGLAADVRSGYVKEQKAAELEFQRKKFEQDVDWRNLTLEFAEAKRRVELARRIEGIQQRKLRVEEERHRRGRTTTFQVLTFEQDFTSAQLARIRAQAGLLGVLARMKTYGDSYEPAQARN